MAVKSIIEVEVNDDAFNAFKAAFDKYNAELAKQPKAWQEIGKTTKGATKGFEATSREMVVQQGAATKILAAQKATSSILQTQERAWRNIARETKSAAGNIVAATVSLAKWAGITGALSGLIGAGGLWGIDRLAQGVSGGRRSSTGLGVSYGQERAFGLNFGRYVDTGSMLSGVSNALRDVTSRGYVGLRGAGISGQYLEGHNSAEVSAELLHRIPGMFSGTKEGLIGAKLKALGLDEFLSSQDVSRYLHATPAERAAQEKSYATDAGKLNLSPTAQLKWQNLETQLDRAGKRIETVFVKGLTDLAGPLDHISTGFINVVEAFSKSSDLKKWMAGIGDGLEAFAKYVGTPEFVASVESAAKSINDLAHIVVKAVSWITGNAGNILGVNSAHAETTGRTGGIQLSPQIMGARGSGRQALGHRGSAATDAGALAVMDRLVRVHGWTPEAAAIAAGNVAVESGARADGSPGDVGSVPGGSWGIAQWNRKRLAHLKEFAARQGKSWQDRDVQTDFLAMEGEGMIPGWKKERSLRNAAAIGHQFEGYGSNTEAARVGAAQNYLSKYNNLNKPQSILINNGAGADVNMSTYAASLGQ